MTSKPTPFAFQPAPRPTPRVTPDVAEQLAGAAADLGFSRPSSAPQASPKIEALAPAQKPAPGAGRTAPKSSIAPVARTSRPPRVQPAAGDGQASLKFEVPEDLWTALKIEAAKRRVTVKFLVLEALSRQGYEVDLDAIPEDGRRLR